jgi:hypothetical protein
MEIINIYHKYHKTQNRKRKMATGVCPICSKKHKGTYENIKRLKTCGCLRAEQARKNGRTRTTEKAFTNGRHNSYKQSALKRKIHFDLTPEDVHTIIIQDCIYCGQKPLLRDIKYIKGIQYPHNTIDRIDSNKGYIRNNIQSCCKICNMMKNSLTSEEFLEHIKRIYSYNER